MTKTLALYNHYSRSAFALLACVCALSVFLYGFFLLEAVAHAASRARSGHEMAALKLELSDLESRYLAVTQALTPARAKELGLVTPQHVTTVYAERHTLTLGGAAAQ